MSTSFGPRTGEQRNTSQQQQGIEKSALEIGEILGCLEADHVGRWLLTNASQPTASETATSSMELKTVAAGPLGSQHYRLLGVGVFNPSDRRGKKVTVKGILISGSDGIRINVTSLQVAAPNCAK